MAAGQPFGSGGAEAIRSTYAVVMESSGSDTGPPPNIKADSSAAITQPHCMHKTDIKFKVEVSAGADLIQFRSRFTAAVAEYRVGMLSRPNC